MRSDVQINRLYALLGVEPGVTPEELKRAFRKKAKELHPDRSKEPDAHEKFLQLNEAYDFLSKLVESSHQHGGKVVDSEDLYKIWEQTERQRVRKSVKDHLKKKYSGSIRYINDPIYEALEIVFVHFNFLLALFSILIMPVILISAFGSTGIVMSVLANVFLLLFTMSAARNLHRLDIKAFFSSLKLLLTTKPAKTGILITFNAFAFFVFGVNTLIDLTQLLLSYTVISLSALMLVYLKKRRTGEKLASYDVYFRSLSAAPAVVSLFLTLNSVFSTTPHTEVYQYTAHTRDSYTEGGATHKRKSGLIELENGAYSTYAGIRLFINGTDLSDEGTITYTFENGAFGLRVLKKYQLGKLDKN
jgi:hypothetical protein